MTLESYGGGSHYSNDKDLEEAYEKERAIRTSLEEKLSSL